MKRKSDNAARLAVLRPMLSVFDDRQITLFRRFQPIQKHGEKP